MRIAHCFAIVLVWSVALFAMGCHRKSPYTIFQWTTTDVIVDSLTQQLEVGFLQYQPADTVLNILTQLEIHTKRTGPNTQLLHARVLYFKARYIQRFHTQGESHSLITKALALIDSTKHPYEWSRFTTQRIIGADTIDGAAQYRHYAQALAYSREIGDKAYEGIIAINMGNLMRKAEVYDKAMAYYRLCDSLNTELGFYKIPLINKINVAAIYGLTGNEKKATEILTSVLNDSNCPNDTLIRNTLLRNLYQSTHNTQYLRDAYEHIKESSKYRGLRGYYASQLADEFYNSEEYDSVIIYAQRAMTDLPYTTDYGQKAIIWYNRGLAWSLINEADSTLYCRIHYEMYADSLRLQQRATEIIRLSALEEMRRQDINHKFSQSRLKWMAIVLVLIILATTIIVILALNHHRLRQRNLTLSKQLELEKAKRKLAATTLTIEQKDMMLASLRDELSALRKDGEIREGSARRLESSIKSYLSEQHQDETFREMFDVIHPNFTQRLRELSPDLAESYVKLATYLVMELDNKKIASLMMIKPESVHQARWRLRRRLNIPADIPLEDFLHLLNQ